MTLLPPMEAVLAAKEQSLAASEELDRGLRRAFFAESRCISLRHVILEVASDCDSLDVATLADALDSGRLAAGALRRLGDGPRRRGAGLRRTSSAPMARTPRTPASNGVGGTTIGTDHRHDDPAAIDAFVAARRRLISRPAAGGVSSTCTCPPFETPDRRSRRRAAPLPRGLRRADRGRGLPAGDLHVRPPRVSSAPPRRQPARLALHHRAAQGDRCRPSHASSARPRRLDGVRAGWHRRQPRPPTTALATRRRAASAKQRAALVHRFVFDLAYARDRRADGHQRGRGAPHVSAGTSTLRRELDR